jgi:type I restriction enzyme R subunit
MDLTVLLYDNGYPPDWDEEVFEQVLEQAENFKKYADESEFESGYKITQHNYGTRIAAVSPP